MKFRKKPVVIDAVQFVYSNDGIAALREFCGIALGRVVKSRHPVALGEAEIGTSEDGTYFKVVHIATEGDWIIRGVQGEFYACRNDVFEMTYEKVND